jgi:2-dehydro-3-deoxyphosphogluconate aldolase/(4S)-4-hydroxy-2-oxoglutarate aldolase
MRRDDALRIVLETKVIAVIRMKDPRLLAQVVEAIRAGGIRAVEITMTVPGAADIIRDLVRNKPADGLVGAGTVLDAAAAVAVLEAGAEFVVSPVTDFEVVRLCRERDVLVVPGAYTPTEILAAWRAGPISSRSFRRRPRAQVLPGPAALPDVRPMPTGGPSRERQGLHRPRRLRRRGRDTRYWTSLLKPAPGLSSPEGPRPRPVAAGGTGAVREADGPLALARG